MKPGDWIEIPSRGPWPDYPSHLLTHHFRIEEDTPETSRLVCHAGPDHNYRPQPEDYETYWAAGWRPEKSYYVANMGYSRWERAPRGTYVAHMPCDTWIKLPIDQVDPWPLRFEYKLFYLDEGRTVIVKRYFKVRAP